MKKTIYMKAGGLYLFQGSACSNTLYFESLDDAKLFLKLANKKLKKYLYIHEFMLNQDGWVLLARLKSKTKIQQAFSKDNKDSSASVWKIISEMMRQFISEYVVKYNRRTGREGGLVRRNYERFFFETVKEAKRTIRKIRKRQVGLQQSLKKYRPSRGQYRISKKMGSGSIFLSSRRRNWKRGELRNSSELTVFQIVNPKVARLKLKKHISNTLSLHRTPPPDS